MNTVDRRVVITGIGMINPLGNNAFDIWNAVIDCEVGIKATPEELKKEIVSPLYGIVEYFNPVEILSNRKAAKLMGKDSLLGIKAAREALNDAGWIQFPDNSDKFGLYVSTGLTYGATEDIFPIVSDAFEDNVFSMELFGSRSLFKCNPLLSFKILTNMPACHISIELGFDGPNLVFNPWPVQGAQALGEAFLSIKRGQLDHVLVGSTESRLHFAGIQTMDDEVGIYKGGLCESAASLPFGCSRKGVVPSEGAAFLVLESYDSAKTRSTKIYGEILGYGQCNALEDNEEEIIQAIINTIDNTLSSTKSSYSGVEMVISSASSSINVDKFEGLALEKVLCAKDNLAWTPKSFYGEMGAASFITSIALGSLALSEGIVPPSLNGSGCEYSINLTAKQPTRRNLGNCLCLACEAGSSEAGILLGRVDE